MWCRCFEWSCLPGAFPHQSRLKAVFKFASLSYIRSSIGKIALEDQPARYHLGHLTFPHFSIQSQGTIKIALTYFYGHLSLNSGDHPLFIFRMPAFALQAEPWSCSQTLGKHAAWALALDLHSRENAGFLCQWFEE